MNYSTLEASKMTDLITVKIFSCMGVLSLIAELCCHIVIYKKKTNIESRAQVYEVRGNKIVSQMRHQRNVVSILGHFLTFSIIFGHYIIFASAYFIVPETLLLRIQCILHFLDPCLIFFLCPLIETMSSGTLRDNLFSRPQLWWMWIGMLYLSVSNKWWINTRNVETDCVCAGMQQVKETLRHGSMLAPSSGKEKQQVKMRSTFRELGHIH